MQFSPDELAIAECDKNQAKLGKNLTIMNEYVAVASQLDIFALSDSAYLDNFCFINNLIS